jgi:hypothetical protein
MACGDYVTAFRRNIPLLYLEGETSTIKMEAVYFSRTSETLYERK